MQVLPKARQGKKKAGNKPADYRKASFASQRGEAADQQTTPASHSPDSRSCTHLQVYPQAPFRRRLFRIRSRVHGAPGLSIYVFSSLALPTAQAIVPLTASAAISLSLCAHSLLPRLASPRPAPPRPAQPPGLLPFSSLHRSKQPKQPTPTRSRSLQSVTELDEIQCATLG